MNFLGIDQSYKSCGIIILDEKDKSVYANTHTADSAQDIFEKSWNTAWHIKGIVNSHKPEHIAIEGLAFGMRGSATRDLAGLQFQIITMLRFHYKYTGTIDIVSPLSLKKFATGSGKAKKDEMILALPANVKQQFEKLGYKRTTGMADLADAFWLAKYIQHKYNHKPNSGD